MARLVKKPFPLRPSVPCFFRVALISTPTERVSAGALYNMRDMIEFVEHFDRQVEAMLAGARKSNKNARRWIEYTARVAAGDSESRARKAA
jgi:hypothetical protein